MKKRKRIWKKLISNKNRELSNEEKKENMEEIDIKTYLKKKSKG